MPGGDKTGPMGYGPMSGRGLGLCAGNPNPGYANPGYGRGLGRGRGFSRGRRFYQGYWRNPDPFFRGFSPQIDNEEEKKYLENMIKDLKEEIKTLENRIQELSKEKKESH